MTKQIPDINVPEPVYVDFDPIDESCQRYSFKFPDYNQAAVEELKEAVPSENRGYDPMTHTWTVDAEYAGDAAEVVRQNFNRVQILWGDRDWET